MSANYSISSFSSKWEKSVKKPEDIFFSITMGTISEYFIEAIQNKKQIQSNSYQRDLLKMLQDRVNNSIESNILKKVSPKTIQNLSVTLPSQPRVKDFKKEIKSVNSAYKKFSFIRAAKNELFSIIDQNRSDLEYDVCMNYLHRGLLFNYSAKFLEKAPEILFPKIFFSKYHDQMEKEIFKNNSMKKHMSKIIEKYKKQFSKRNSSKKTKKLVIVTSKTTIKNGKTQIGFHDGRSLISDKAISVGDSCLIQVPEQKILDVIKLEKGSQIIVIKGVNAGQIGSIEEIKEGTFMLPKHVLIELGERKIEIPATFVMLVGKGKPVIQIR